MPSGIIICGANGSGKTTLGRELAKALNYKHMDIQDYYFAKSQIPYTVSRSRDEMQSLMLMDINRHKHFIISAVNGKDFGEKITSMYDCVIYLSAPLELGLKRVKQRAFDKFGERLLKGGDMYDSENNFLNFVASRSMENTENWIEKLKCPVIRADGTSDIADNVKLLSTKYRQILELEK